MPTLYLFSAQLQTTHVLSKHAPLDLEGRFIAEALPGHERLRLLW